MKFDRLGLRWPEFNIVIADNRYFAIAFYGTKDNIESSSEMFLETRMAGVVSKELYRRIMNSTPRKAKSNIGWHTKLLTDPRQGTYAAGIRRYSDLQKWMAKGCPNEWAPNENEIEHILL